MVGPRPKTDQAEGLSWIHWIPGDFGHQLDILSGAEAWHQIVELKNEADPIAPVAGKFAIAQGARIRRLEHHRAGTGPVPPPKEVDQRRLAAAGGAEQHHQLPGCNLQIAPPQGMHRRWTLVRSLVKKVGTEVFGECWVNVHLGATGSGAGGGGWRKN